MSESEWNPRKERKRLWSLKATNNDAVVVAPYREQADVDA